MSTDPVVIASVARTPIGSFQGELKGFSAPQLGAAAIHAAVERAHLRPTEVDEVIMGCVLSAGLGQAPARQASLAAGLPVDVGGTTVNKMCGSGLKAAMLAHDMLLAGNGEIIVAGGMESMTNAPYLAPRARAGLRMGHAQLLDHMFLDGLEDAYDRGRLMGTFAEDTAAKYGFTREEQDAFAVTSLERARNAGTNGAFAWELVPVAIATGKESRFVEADEAPSRADIERIPRLKPAFREGGTVTAANSSSIADGAAALVLMRRSTAERRGLLPIATVVAHATHSQEPAWFTTAPAGALRKVLDKAGWTARDVDIYEINEAFAVVTMAAMKELALPHERVNVNGGACALGHPIGASGARIVATLAGALRRYALKRGVATLCIGGGEAVALAIESA
ncbi:MAG TPA: acetyl-CoA C-acyltransferase [Usitatibacter sp.]|nr:acetyl-CoA C-acyltransferase [Usitatibacter sp.]